MIEKELNLNIYNKKSGSKLNILLYVVIAFLLLLTLFFNFVSLCGISGVSMADTLRDKQNVLLLNGKNATRNDIIVFQHEDKALIKRVIAKEFDKLAFVADADGNVCLYLCNDGVYKRIDESYICEIPMKEIWFEIYDKFSANIYKLAKTAELQDTLDIDAEYVIEVPKNHYFVMGDNRKVSKDSRSIGMIDKSSVYGKLIYKLNEGSLLEKILVFMYGGTTAHD